MNKIICYVYQTCTYNMIYYVYYYLLPYRLQYIILTLDYFHNCPAISKIIALLVKL